MEWPNYIKMLEDFDLIWWDRIENILKEVINEYIRYSRLKTINASKPS